MKNTRLYKLYKFLTIGEHPDRGVQTGIPKELFFPEELKKEKCHSKIRYNDTEECFEVEINSWEESYHNGSPYHESNRKIFLKGVISPPTFGKDKYGEGITLERILKELEESLEKKALLIIKEQIEDYQAQERTRQALGFLEKKIDDPDYWSPKEYFDLEKEKI